MTNLLISVHNIHLFWTTGVYYAVELSRHFCATLLLENCSETDINTIRNLTGGRLQDILWIRKANGIKRHQQYYDMAKRIVAQCKPDIVFAIDDQYPPDLYLLRLSKQIGCINVCFQVGMMEGTIQDLKRLWDNAAAARSATTMHIPHMVALLGVRAGQHIRHLWHYWVAPTLVARQQFPGNSSVYLHKGATGMRDSEYLIVFSERDRRLHLQSGTQTEIIVIPHPLTWPSSKAIIHELFMRNKLVMQNGEDTKIATIFLTTAINEYAISRDMDRRVDQREIYISWKNLIEVTAQKFPDHQVLVKPHPAMAGDDKFLCYLKEATKTLSNVMFLDRTFNTWSLVAESRIIIAGISTILFIASLGFPEKIIISMDLERRLTGDVFKDSPNIVYFEDLKTFAKCDLASARKVESIITDGDQKLLAFVESLIHERELKRSNRK